MPEGVRRVRALEGLADVSGSKDSLVSTGGRGKVKGTLWLTVP